jgi:hypothetical protein
MATKTAFNFLDSEKWNGDSHHCAVCNRKLAGQHLYVEVGIDGFEFGTTDCTDSQGAFGIGPECAKKFAQTTVAL